MKNFILFFNEKEGTTAMVRLLNKFSSVSVIFNENDKGNEPFNYHNCGRMKQKDFISILDIIYGQDNPDSEVVNKIYTKSSEKRIGPIKNNVSVGHKMRFKPHFKSYIAQIFNFFNFKNALIKNLKKNNVVVFLAVRKDTLRWALSKYHGSGKGEKGHLQFKLASGKIKKEDIGKIHVNPGKLRRIIFTCKLIHRFNKYVLNIMKKNDIEAYPLFYEDFLNDKVSFFRDILDKLEIKNVTDKEISEVVESGTKFKKVHSDDISEFVENHEEILALAKRISGGTSPDY